MESTNIVFTERGKVEVLKQELPAPGAREIQCRAEISLISIGTELRCLYDQPQAGTSWSGWVKYPFLPGYSMAATVVAVGSEVTEYRPGDRVAAFQEHTQYFNEPVDNNKFLHKIPEGISFDEAAWMGIGGCITQTCARRSELHLGENVGIIGLGMLGQMITQYIRMMGAGDIIAIDMNASRLEMARKHGADHTICLPADHPMRKSVVITNPLGEDTSIMRTTILPSMLEIIARNHSYRNKSARLYELGKIYLPREDGLADEPKYLSLGAYGDGVDFFSFKGSIETLLHELRITDVKYVACTDNDSYHPGRCAKVYAGETYLGVFGQIHPLVAANYGMDTEVYTAELSFDAMYEKRGDIPVYQPLPKFPAVTRDIAVVCDEAVTVGALEESIRRGAKGLLKDVSLFDIYRGPGVAIGKKSVAFNLVLRADDRSLTGEEADEDVQSILAALKADHNAVLR